MKRRTKILSAAAAAAALSVSMFFLSSTSGPAQSSVSTTEPTVAPPTSGMVGVVDSNGDVVPGVLVPASIPKPTTSPFIQRAGSTPPGVVTYNEVDPITGQTIPVVEMTPPDSGIQSWGP